MPKKIKVMIVDDQKSIQALLCNIINDLGAEVVAQAEDGEQAVELYKQHKPHIVLMDINMPKMDGIEALKLIMEINPKALVIMLTSLDAGDIVQQSISLGARNFLLKSNPPDVIAQEVKDSWKDYLTELKSLN